MADFNKYNREFSTEENSRMAQVKQYVTQGTTSFDYPEPVKGSYLATIDKMSLEEVGNKLSFKLTFKLLEGTDKETELFMKNWPGRNSPKIPFSRPVSGTKNDASCIGSVIGMLNRFVESESISFEGNYNALAVEISDIFNAVKDTYAYDIQYNPEEFYRFNILGILKKDDGQKTVEAPESLEEQQNKKADIQKMQMGTSFPVETKEETTEYMDFSEDFDEDLPF